MKNVSLKMILWRGVCTRVCVYLILLAGGASLAVYVFSPLGSVSRQMVLNALAIGIPLDGLCLILSLILLVRRQVLRPLKDLNEANRQSLIDKNKFMAVEFPPRVALEWHDMTEFRNALIRKVKNDGKKRHRRSSDTLDFAKWRDGIVAALEKANAYNDDDTGDHMHRLALYSKFLGEKRGLSAELVDEIATYASLHDVGKVGIPDAILKKPGRLTPEEWEVMQTHPRIGHDLLHSIGLNQVAQNIALYHHEKWNGQGYPEGLAGEDIPIEARVVAIADVFDALINERVYKPAYPREKVEKIFKEEIGRHFDPVLGQMAYDHLDELYHIYYSHVE